MAATATVEQTISLGGTEYMYIGTLGVTGTYTTGGETLDVSGNSRIEALWVVGAAGGYEIRWDRDNQKAIFYQGDNTNAASAPLIQVANATNHTAANGAVFVAIGQ